MFSKLKIGCIALLILTCLGNFSLYPQTNIDLHRAVFFNQQPQPPEPQNPLSVQSSGVTDRTPTQSVDSSYILSANDTISIQVFSEPDLTTTTRISPQGNVALSLVGTLKLGGKTVLQATEHVRKAYQDGYIRDPKVIITVIEFAKKRFNVLGQVQRPGSYEIPQQEQATLLQAIAMAGGYTRIADPGTVTVKRILPNGKEVILQLNAKVMAEDKNAPVFPIQHNDTITVSESIF